MISRLNFTGDFEFFISQNNLNFIDIIENLDRSKNLIIVTYNIFTKTNLILERLKLLENFEEIIIITNIPGRFEQYYGNQNEKARKEIQKYLDLLEPLNFKTHVKVYFNFSNHSKIYLTDEVVYIGSGNFSDASKNNIEAGVIIKSHEQRQKLYEEVIKKIELNTIRYFGKEIEKHKNKLSGYLKKIDLITDTLRELICEFNDDGSSGSKNIIKVDIEIPGSTIEEIYNLIEDLHNYITLELIDSSKISFEDFLKNFESLYDSLSITLDKLNNFSFDDTALSYFEDNFSHMAEIDDSMETSISKAFERQTDIEHEIIWSRQDLFKSFKNLKLLLQPTVDLIENYLKNQNDIDNT